MKRVVILAAAALGIALGASSSQASAPASILFSADRAPTVTGEIYRLDPNGHRVDLSKSPYQDLVSRRLARRETRRLRPRPRLEDSRVRGRRTRRSPGRCRAARPTSGGVGMSSHPCVAAGNEPARRRRVRHEEREALDRPTGNEDDASSPLPDSNAAWSPDGHVLVASSPSPHSGTVLHAYSSSGSPLWQAARSFPFEASWSSSNLLAVPSKTGLTVYDEYGHELSQTPGHISGGPAWSPNGQFVAVIAGGRLVVRTPSGEGVLVYKRLSTGHGLVWNGNNRVVLGGYGSCGCKARILDVRTGALTPADVGQLVQRTLRRREARPRHAGSGAGVRHRRRAGRRRAYEDLLQHRRLLRATEIGCRRSLRHSSPGVRSSTRASAPSRSRTSTRFSRTARTSCRSRMSPPRRRSPRSHRTEARSRSSGRSSRG